MTITWTDFQSGATQLAVLVAVTGLIYRLLRLFFPDVPEAVMQFIAAILSSASALVTTYTPGVPYHQWLTLGLASGILMSQNVIKSMDWIASALTKTGGPEKPQA